MVLLRWTPTIKDRPAAVRLKKIYGDRLCIYTIAVGSKPGKYNHLDKLAEAGGCGYATRAEDIAGGAGMTEFVHDVFLMEQHDDDGDGVRNNQDQCPQTPSGGVKTHAVKTVEPA